MGKFQSYKTVLHDFHAAARASCLTLNLHHDFLVSINATSRVMFDIRSFPTNSIQIKSLSFLTSEATPCDVEVYTKDGSYEFFEETRNAWTMIVNDSIQCLGPGSETILTEDIFMDMDQLKIVTGSKRAFYIKLNGADIVYSMVNEDQKNAIYVLDGNIQIFSGAGLGGFFQNFLAPRMWNGRVVYEVISTDNSPGQDTCSRFVQSNSVELKNHNYGMMFDLRSKTSSILNIKSMTIFVDTNKLVEYEVYTIPGGFNNGLGLMLPWSSPIAKGSGRSESSGQLVISESDFQDVKLNPGKSIGIYITLKSPNLLFYITPLSMNSNFLQNDDIAVSVGSSVQTYPQKTNSFFEKRGFYGQIYYTSNDSCDLETKVSYLFVIHYPSDWTLQEVKYAVQTRIESAIPRILTGDDIFDELIANSKLILDNAVPYKEGEILQCCILLCGVIRPI